MVGVCAVRALIVTDWQHRVSLTTDRLVVVTGGRGQFAATAATSGTGFTWKTTARMLLVLDRGRVGVTGAAEHEALAPDVKEVH